MSELYDVVVIGGGAVGENAAGYAAARGFSTCLIERDLVGGECSYWACMPSKALLRPGEALAAARRVPAAADAVRGGVDVAKTFKSRDAFTSQWDDSGQAEWLDAAGVMLIRGEGRLTGPRQVEVETADGTQLAIEAQRAVVLATGTRAAMPPVEGLDEVDAWDNRDATAAQAVPGRLLILGGGPVGVEMAQAFRRLGSREVTVVERAGRLLENEEPFAGKDLQDAFAEEGIAVLTHADAVRAARSGGEVTLTIDDGRTLVADEILMAAGRRPGTDSLGLDTVGLEPGAFVRVDDQLRAEGVDGDWLFAVGDVNGRALLTHQGKYQARIAADVLAGKDLSAWADHRAVPRVVFTDPQVAAVGMTEQRANDAGIMARILTHELGDTAGGALHGVQTRGTAQLVVDTSNDTIVGATFTGPNVAEMLHAATIAITGGVTLDQLWHAVPAFPTMSEAWLRLLESARAD